MGAVAAVAGALGFKFGQHEPSAAPTAPPQVVFQPGAIVVQAPTAAAPPPAAKP